MQAEERSESILDSGYNISYSFVDTPRTHQPEDTHRKTSIAPDIL